MFCRAMDFCTDLRHQLDMLSEKEPPKEGVGRAPGKANFHRASAAGNKKRLLEVAVISLTFKSSLSNMGFTPSEGNGYKTTSKLSPKPSPPEMCPLAWPFSNNYLKSLLQAEVT